MLDFRSRTEDRLGPRQVLETSACPNQLCSVCVCVRHDSCSCSLVQPFATALADTREFACVRVLLFMLF